MSARQCHRIAASALNKLLQEGAKKLVLDLRNDAYGDPEEGLAVANLFVENGMLGYLQGQKVPLSLILVPGGADVIHEGQTHALRTNWRLGDLLLRGLVLK